MKNFKTYITQIDELQGVAPKSKGEHKFVHSTYMAQVKDPGDLEKVGPEEVGPADTKLGQGKRPADRLDNKQKFGEGKDVEDEEEIEDDEDEDEKNKKKMKSSKVKEETMPKTFYEFKKSCTCKDDDLDEADFTKQQTKMAHTIGKEFEKKGVGDKSKGGPYAVASAMVRDKPEAAKKAYATIKSKMKEDTDADILFKLYSELDEENQQVFMQQLSEDAELMLDFAKNLME